MHPIARSDSESESAEEYANVACFLASDAASYVTGTALNIDGGASPVV